MKRGSEEKHFWLRIKNNFFIQTKIKKLRKLDKGDTCICIYLKMLLMAMEDSGRLSYEKVEDTFEEELALKLDEELADVQFLLIFLKEQNLIEEIEENMFLLNDILSMIGSESASAKRVRKHRKKAKKDDLLHCNDDVTKCNDDVTKCNDDVTMCNDDVTMCNDDVTKGDFVEIEIDDFLPNTKEKNRENIANQSEVN